MIWKIYNISIKENIKNLMPDKMYLKWLFPKMVGYKLDFRAPKSFNEKLQWLKIYDRNPYYTKLVDKYEVKKIVKEKIGEKYIIPTLGIWNSFDEICFEDLPYQFVLKATHDSGSTVVCRNKDCFDILAAQKKLTEALSQNFFYKGREWPYKNVKPRIIAEQYLNPGANEDLIDYKFMCFNGSVKCCFVCTDRFSKDGLKVTFFDNKWNKMPFERHYPSSNKDIKKPQNFERMIYLAEKLSENIPFVRIDFYEYLDQIYFGEYTFFPGGGMEEFSPKSWDFKLGSWITLPKKSFNIK